MNWDYIAGFFDGEGCIFTTKNRDTIRVNMGQNTRVVLDEIVDFLVEYGIYAYVYRRSPNGTRKESYIVEIHDQSCVKEFLVDIVDLLIVKKDRAMDALANIRVPRRLSQEQIDCIGVMVADGFTQRYIANYLGMSRGAIQNQIKSWRT